MLAQPHTEHQMTADKKWFDDNGLTTDYENELRYLHTARAEARSEAEQGRAAEGFDWRLAREKSQAYSTDTFATVTRFINGGGILTESDIRGMSGNGEGQMSKSDVDSAVAAMKARNKNPEYAGALNYLDAYYGIPKGSDPDTVFAQNAQYAASFREFQKAANEHPEKPKLELMQGIIKGGQQANVMSWTDRLFGTSQPKPVAPKPPATQTAPKVGDKKKFPNGKIGVWDGTGYVAQ